MKNFFYYSCIVDVQYTIDSDTGVSFFDVESDWRRIQLISLILFLRLF